MCPKKVSKKNIDVASMTFDQIQEWMEQLGLPAYKGRQVFRWLHQKGVRSWKEMTDVAKKVREAMNARDPQPIQELALAQWIGVHAITHRRTPLLPCAFAANSVFFA